MGLFITGSFEDLVLRIAAGNLNFVFDEVVDGVAGKIIDGVVVEVVDTCADTIANEVSNEIANELDDEVVAEILAISDRLYTQKNMFTLPSLLAFVKCKILMNLSCVRYERVRQEIGEHVGGGKKPCIIEIEKEKTTYKEYKSGVLKKVMLAV
ncbi:hypothetical protein V6N13_001564 [Hibiscus sabdariffa]